MLEYDIIENYFHLRGCGVSELDCSKLLNVGRCTLHKIRVVGTENLEMMRART